MGTYKKSQNIWFLRLTKLSCCVVTLIIVVFFGQRAEATLMFYVANPTSNSVDWTNSVTGLGGVVNSNVNFDAHPLGALQNNFYLGSDGVTIASNATGGIVFGSGPGQSNTGTAPGEGLHPASNYLRSAPGISGVATTTTVSFSSGVIGAGLFAVDYFDSGSVMTLEAYDGVNGTGNLLGLANAVAQNFQQDRLYFMGVSDTSNMIRSIVLSHDGALNDVIGLDDIRFAVPEPATITLFGLGVMALIRRRRR